jgi:predicted transcriptional regulator
MAPRMPKPSTTTTTVKLDIEIKERVRRLASARRRSPHWLMREAIEEYVEREEKREQFRQGALVAWDHYQTTGLHLSAEEADAWLAKLEAGKDAPPPKCHD